jgi:hypothetical protein
MYYPQANFLRALLRYNVGAALRGRPNNPHLTIEKWLE